MTARRLSLCMIVKDEAVWIARCLSSVRGVVDEIVIIDTGSKDSTCEIARSFGAAVFDYPWTGNFAEARNYGLAKATGDWILWLDADEEVDAITAPRLREILDREDMQLAFIELINFYGDCPPSASFAYRLAHHRLFRNGMGFRFHNRIHEQLNADEILSGAVDIPRLPVKVYHYGYLDAVTVLKAKSQRNLNMLLAEVEKPNPDPWLEYHLASEYFRILDYHKAFAHVNQSIIQFVQKGLTPPSMLYKLKYASLLSLGSFDGAWPAIDKAIAIYPDYVDLHFYKGVILLHKNRMAEALASFQHCLDLGEAKLTHLTLKGVGSFQAWYYIGQIHEKQGRFDQAREAYGTTLILSSDHTEAREAYLRLQTLASLTMDDDKEDESGRNGDDKPMHDCTR